MQICPINLHTSLWSINRGSWWPGMGLITWRNAAACGKAPVGGPRIQGHGCHPGQEMPCLVPVLLASPAGGVGHISRCHTNACLLKHLPRNVTDATQHPATSHLGSTCRKPLSSSGCVSTCSPCITGGISPGSRHLLLGSAGVSHQLLALPFLVWAQADAVLLQHSSGAPHCLFWRSGTKFVR